MRGKEKGGRAQHVNVIPSIDPSASDCSLHEPKNHDFNSQKKKVSMIKIYNSSSVI